MASTLNLLPPEQLSLLNSLLRSDNSVKEIARQTFETMGSIGHRRSQRAWEACLYRHREAGLHLKVVRSRNTMADTYAVSDLVIKAIEEALSSEELVSLALLNAIKAVKGSSPAQSLISKLEMEIERKVSGTTTESPNTLVRDIDRNYI